MDFLAVILNQLARFSVPVFVALSGFGLTAKYLEKTKKQGSAAGNISISVGPFYADRLVKIGLPFAFWTIVFLYFRDRLGGPYNAEFFEGMVPYLYRKGADYHFYFFHIIFECYAVFPALAWIMGRGSRYRKVILIVSALLQFYMSQPSHIVFADWPRPPFLFSAFILYWQFPLILGMFLAFQNGTGAAQETHPEAGESLYSGTSGRKEDPATAKWQKSKTTRWYSILATLAFLIALLEYIYWSYRSDMPGDFNHFTRISVMLYSAAVLMLFRSWPEGHVHPALTSSISYLSGLTFFVFIVHTALLRALQHYLPAWLPLTLLLLWFLGFGLAILMDRLIGWRWLRLTLALDKRRTSWPLSGW